MNKNQFRDKLKHKLIKLNLEISNSKCDILWNYMKFLLKENQKYNLTGIEKPETIINKHFVDSLTIFNEISFQKDDKILDIGTGAGFPGMVLKIFQPDIKLVLLDSRLKRINFLRLLVNKSFMSDIYTQNIEIIHDRAEKLGKNEQYRDKFNFVVSRAVASLNVLCEYSIPFLAKNGYCIFYKGSEYKKELNESKEALNILGGVIDKTKEVKLSFIEEERYLILIKKISQTPIKYPRRNGIPKKRPL